MKISELLCEGQPGETRKQVCDKVMIRHIVAVQFQPLHVVRGKVGGELGGGKDHGGGVHGFVVKEGESQGRGEVTKLKPEKVDQSTPEICEKSGDPFRVLTRLQGLQHYDCMFSGEIIFSLTEVGRSKPSLLPEPQQVRGQTKGDSEILKILWRPFSKLKEHRR